MALIFPSDYSDSSDNSDNPYLFFLFIFFAFRKFPLIFAQPMALGLRFATDITVNLVNQIQNI